MKRGTQSPTLPKKNEHVAPFMSLQTHKEGRDVNGRLRFEVCVHTSPGF